MQGPTKEELQTRIEEHLNWRPTQETALVWRGYLTALFEWSVIDEATYDYAEKLLPIGIGVKETHEIFSGAPLTKEEAEIDKYQEELKKLNK